MPTRALYMSDLEVTKSNVGTTVLQLGFSELASAVVVNATAGLSASMASQLVWTLVDVISQKLMVEGGHGLSQIPTNYKGGIDAFRIILKTNGLRGLYRGFGLSVAMAGGVSALVITLDTIKTRLQILEGEENKRPSVAQIVKNLVKEGGWSASSEAWDPDHHHDYNFQIYEAFVNQTSRRFETKILLESTDIGKVSR
eukprot:Gb_12654 [translate_table: standard]